MEVIYLKNPTVKPNECFCEPDDFCCSVPFACLCLNAHSSVFNGAIIEMMHVLNSSCANFQPALEMKTFLLISKCGENQKYLWSLYLPFVLYISEIFYSFEYRNKHWCSTFFDVTMRLADNTWWILNKQLSWIKIHKCCRRSLAIDVMETVIFCMPVYLYAFQPATRKQKRRRVSSTLSWKYFENNLFMNFQENSFKRLHSSYMGILKYST